MARGNRIFVNHPKVGTLITYKTIPMDRSSKKRKRLTDEFYGKVYTEDRLYERGFEESYCVHCRKLLLNPQSLLLHKGSHCKHKHNK